MELSELTAYAEEKYHIHEQHKWTDFPGFSVLTDPLTGEWIALLMRQWDSETGTEIQLCDIKCGQQSLPEEQAPYLTAPYRMKGKKWVGVRFGDWAEREVILRLFDGAVAACERRGFPIVLEGAPVAAIPGVFRATALPTREGKPTPSDAAIPERLRQMIGLFEYGDGSFRQKCKNFCVQGRYMEDYEDDAPWDGEFRLYFPTYHDLNVRQLRGYFTWRAQIRRGSYRPVTTSLAYLYLYELLNEIGTASPEESLRRMREFEIGYLDAGFGDARMRSNLRRWMLELSVIRNVPADAARQYVDPSTLTRDAALSVLSAPCEHTDDEVFSALCVFAGGRSPERSPAVMRDGTKARHFFAETWRYAADKPCPNGKPLFTACFGRLRRFTWHPLGNAVYWFDREQPDITYELDACRRYYRRGNVWQEERYDKLYFDTNRLLAFLHETDRQLRKYLKAGRYLREKQDEAWAAPFIAAVIEADRSAEREAAKPRIMIDLSDLEKIRQDARQTRDSLLSEEEMREPGDSGLSASQSGQTSEGAVGGESDEENGECIALDAQHRQILSALLRGESSAKQLEGTHQMPSVVVDTINEAFFDAIGDNILEYDGQCIAVIEDYRADVAQMLGG